MNVAAWILILTIQTGVDGVAISSVPGFDSYEACMAAGEKWGRMVLNTKRSGLSITATCVSTRAPKQ